MLANLRQLYQKLIKNCPLLKWRTGFGFFLDSASRPSNWPNYSLAQCACKWKTEILEELDVRKRLKKLPNSYREIQRNPARGEQIQSEVQDEISKTQREYFLREQLKAIRKELGEDEGTLELKEIRRKN